MHPGTIKTRIGARWNALCERCGNLRRVAAPGRQLRLNAIPRIGGSGPHKVRPLHNERKETVQRRDPWCPSQSLVHLKKRSIHMAAYGPAKEIRFAAHHDPLRPEFAPAWPDPTGGVFRGSVRNRVRTWSNAAALNHVNSESRAARTRGNQSGARCEWIETVRSIRHTIRAVRLAH